MGVGGFDKPPESPKIGPTKQFSELSKAKQEELGDLADAAKDTVFKPAALPPELEGEELELQRRKGEEEQVALSDQPPKEPTDWENQQEPDPRLVKAAESFGALKSVISREEEEHLHDEVRLQKAAVPTDEDKENLFRALLGGLRYEKTFELFGGMVRVTLTELTQGEEDAIFVEMGKAQSAGVVKTEDDWMVLFDRMRMMYGVKEIQTSGQDSYSRDPEKADRIQHTDAEAFVGRFKGSILYQSLLKSSRVFRAQTEMMTEAASESDFWKVGGPDSQSSLPPEEPSTIGEALRQVHGDSSKESSSPESNGS